MMIQFFKKNPGLILIVFIVVLLVLIRALSGNHFKNDAKRWAKPSMSKSNIISSEELGTMKGHYQLISLGKGSVPLTDSVNTQRIDPDSIFTKKYIKSILKFEGQIILYSSDPGISARIWMMLSQMGRTNLFILTNGENNEVLRYKLGSDSILLN